MTRWLSTNWAEVLNRNCNCGCPLLVFKSPTYILAVEWVAYCNKCGWKLSFCMTYSFYCKHPNNSFEEVQAIFVECFKDAFKKNQASAGGV